MHLPAPTWTSSWPTGRPVGVWRLCLNALGGDPEAVLRRLTVPSEHDRARRYAFAADRHRHLAGRALVRLVLSRWQNCTPASLAIAEGPHGKPRLQDPPADGPRLHFNIGHTGPVVVAAVSEAQPVGIDVEPHTRSVDAPSLAERVLTASERDRWRSRPASCRQAALLHLWTCKEAFLKATGEGLRRAPTTVESIADGSTVVALRDAPGSSAPSSAPADEWSVRPFSATNGLLGAIVRKGTMPSPVSWVDATDIVTRSAE